MEATQTIAAMIVPTGVGASVGGFSGDATPAMNLLASACDVLITHPNVANAAVFQNLPPNALYVEGYALDQFLMGRWNLLPLTGGQLNRLAVVFDRGIPSRMLTLHRNVVAAVKTVYGLSVVTEVMTDTPLHLGLYQESSGASVGTLQNPDVLLAACEKAYQQGGQVADAIALCAYFGDELLAGLENPYSEQQYEQGEGVDPIGGLEAVLSHLVVKTFQKPCAHAPVFSEQTATPAYDRLVDPRAAAEYIAPTFLPCVLQGLSRAPMYGSYDLESHTGISVADLSALIVPQGCMGGIPVLAALERNIPVVVVNQNQTVLGMHSRLFNNHPRVYVVDTYEQAADWLKTRRTMPTVGGGS